jgi:hypothetical protein
MGIEVFVSPEKEEERKFEERAEAERNIEINMQCMKMALSILSAQGSVTEAGVFDLAKRIKDQVVSST